jgi:predicted SAM-dependent methyltransferase
MEIIDYIIDGIKLDIGCGKHPREGYEHLDIQPLEHIEYVCDASKELPFKDNSLSAVYSSNTLEHFSWRDVDSILKMWVRKLKVKAKIELKVPCQKSVSRAYYEGRIKAKEFSNATYADQDDYTNYHKCAFDPEWLSELLKDAGCKDIKVTEEYKDEVGELTGFLIEGVKA